LLRPKKKRPQNMTIEEFQEVRRKEIADEENKKFSMLKSEVVRLEEFYELIKRENDRIEDSLQSQQELEADLNNRTNIADEIKNSQVLYNSLNQSLASSEKTHALNELFKSIKDIKVQNETLLKEYIEEK
jgi:hypothetical protein